MRVCGGDGGGAGGDRVVLVLVVARVWCQARWLACELRRGVCGAMCVLGLQWGCRVVRAMCGSALRTWSRGPVCVALVGGEMWRDGCCKTLLVANGLLHALFAPATWTAVPPVKYKFN